MTNNYARAYTEVIEILNHFSEKEYSKIPKEKIKFYEENMDKEYKYLIDPTISMAEQNLSREANSIIVMLFRDYFASDIQKEKLKSLLNQNQIKNEEEKREIYNPNNIFRTKTNFNQEEADAKELIIYKENAFLKIINKIKSIFIR